MYDLNEDLAKIENPIDRNSLSTLFAKDLAAATKRAERTADRAGASRRDLRLVAMAGRLTALADLESKWGLVALRR